jgi:chromate transporter
MTTSPSRPSLTEAFWTWLRIGLLSFGGPAGQIAMMHKTLVEDKKWISNDRFLHALNYCHFLPGPEAQQLATYVGWLMHRTWGGIMAGTLFVLPGFFVIMALSALYAAYRQIPAVDALFYGLKPAVLAIVIGAVLRVGGKSMRTRFALGLAAFAFVALFAFDVPFPLVVFGAALLGWLKSRSSAEQGCTAHCEEEEDIPEHARPSASRSLRVLATWVPLWLGPVLVIGLLFGWDDIYARLAVFFSKMAVVTFGGAYAVLSYVAQQAVEGYGWLSPADMISGLALAETTPGPLILVLEYVGFMAAFASPGALHPLLAGALGAALTVWVTFTPCFLWIFLGAPYMEAIRGNRNLSAALAGVTAAVVGVILNLSLWFGLHTLFGEVGSWHGPLGLKLPVPNPGSLDLWALILSIGALLALTRFKIGMGTTLAGCAALGWVVRMLA